MPAFHLAQINVARMRHPIDAPEMEQFVERLDPVNAMADAAPGFIWRLIGDGGRGAVDIRASDDPLLLINMSVWTDLASLGAYVFRSGHLEIMRRRREFFLSPTEASMALWWVEAGAIPTVEEGLARLEHLRRHGPTPRAFSFREPFAPETSGEIAPVLDECA